MSIHDVFLLAFQRDLQTATPHALDHYVRLYWDDRTGFLASEEAAWASGRSEPFISMARVRAMNGALAAEGYRRLITRLLESRRFGEALEALQDAGGQLDRDRTWLMDIARAELGLGHVERAVVALEAACGGHPEADEEIARFDGWAAAFGRLRTAALESRRWEDTRLLFDRWMKIGADRPAFDAIIQFVGGGGAFGPDQRLSFLGALQTILTLHRPISPWNLFRSLDQVLTSSALRKVLAEICASLSEDPPAEVPADLSYPGLRAAGALALAGAGRLEQAIGILGALTLANPKAERFRAFLGRMVGQSVLAEHPLSYGPVGPRKVFDVFPFNDELRLLKVKFEEMAGWVDHFVLVEARQTFTGQPKPLVFEQNRADFAAFDSKIVHVVVDEFPPYVRHPWAREFYQRNMGVVGLTGRCQEDDLVILSDADEVISGGVVQRFDGEYAHLGMERLRYFLNYREVLAGDQLGVAASLWRARYLRTLGLSYARDAGRYLRSAPRLNDAGWHFTSIADAQGVAAKLSNSAHQEIAGASAESVAAILTELRAGGYQPGWERCEIDDSFPASIRDHREEFADVLL